MNAGESDRRDRKNSAVMATAEQDDRYCARPSQSAGEVPGSYLRRHDLLSDSFEKVECSEEDEELLLSDNVFCFGSRYRLPDDQSMVLLDRDDEPYRRSTWLSCVQDRIQRWDCRGLGSKKRG